VPGFARTHIVNFLVCSVPAPAAWRLARALFGLLGPGHPVIVAGILYRRYGELPDCAACSRAWPRGRRAAHRPSRK